MKLKANQGWPWHQRISLVYPQEFMTWVGPWQLTAWKRNCSIVSPFHFPAPQVGICSFYAAPPESTAAGSTRWPISSGWDSVRQRGRAIQNRPWHSWRLSEGQDGWRPFLTNCNNQPHSGLHVQSVLSRNKLLKKKINQNSLVTDEGGLPRNKGNVRRSQ